MDTVTGTRLRPITMAEIAVRGRQEAFKLLERSAWSRPVRKPTAPPAGLDPRNFFAGASGAETPTLVTEHAPDARTAAIESADDACDGRFRVLGYGTVSFGDPIDWHLDPIARVRAPLVHWSRLDVLDRTQVGDSKVPWELNRQQWLVGLGQAYRLTGDERYCEAFVRSVRQWLEANPKGRGINWASSLEVALRLISWFWALFLFGDAPGVPGEFVAELLDAIVGHAAHVERYLSHYYAPNTHLTGEGARAPLCGAATPRRAPRCALAGPRNADPDRAMRAPDRAGRHILRALHLLPALHGGDLPARDDPRGTQRTRRSRARRAIGSRRFSTICSG